MSSHFLTKLKHRNKRGGNLAWSPDPLSEDNKLVFDIVDIVKDPNSDGSRLALVQSIRDLLSEYEVQVISEFAGDSESAELHRMISNTIRSGNRQLRIDRDNAWISMLNERWIPQEDIESVVKRLRTNDTYNNVLEDAGGGR